jgi:hypothetical protein
MSLSSESELDEDTLTLEQARHGRRLARTKFTKLITTIESAMALSKSIEAVELLKQALQDLYEECLRMHTKCAATIIAGPNASDKDKVEKWAKDLDEAYRRANVSIDSYVVNKNVTDELSRKQKEDEESVQRTARVTTEALIMQQLHEAEQREAMAKAASETANIRAAKAAKDQESLLIISSQKEALKRHHEQEDEEIARKRSAEDAARAENRRKLVNATTRPDQQVNDTAPLTSTPNRNMGFQNDFSLIDPHSTFRRYDTTGNGRTESSTIPNTVDAWIFQPFEPIVQATGGGHAMVTMAMLSKAATFGGEARDWPMFIQTVKSMIHDVFPSDVQRLTMLSTMLAAPIREGMSQIFNSPLAYRAELHELHRKYGHPHLVVRSYIQHLMAISLRDEGANLENFQRS